MRGAGTNATRTRPGALAENGKYAKIGATEAVPDFAFWPLHNFAIYVARNGYFFV